MNKIIFSPPSKSAPGFLKRVRRALELKEQYEQSPTPKLLDMLVQFLADYVTEPVELSERKEALMDASEEQIMNLLMALTGGGANPT